MLAGDPRLDALTPAHGWHRQPFAATSYSACDFNFLARADLDRRQDCSSKAGVTPSLIAGRCSADHPPFADEHCQTPTSDRSRQS